jgi:NAD(P)-dependent dehydrogenase (short-subunit alcohol dehydrogenase family)
MKDVKGKVAVVTGAASGIGRAMAERFAAEGMKLVLADVEERALSRAVADLEAKGATVRAVPTDVAKAGGVEALAAETLDAFGAVHVLCNNAGVVAAGLAWELTVADWEWVLGVNLWGVIHGIRVFVPIMLGQDLDGHIVNTASMAGLVSSPMNAVYNVAKFGVVTLSETLQHDLTLRGARIGVSVLCPGWVNTRILEADRNRPATPGAAAARPPTPEEAAMEQTVRQLLATGLPPAEVAGRVFAAIRDQRFYILTHPEWKELIRTRMEDILEERPPTFAGFA